jgi:hypothetical protein
MAETTVGEHVYRIGRLSARQQFDLLKRLGPALPVFWQEKREGAEQIDGIRWVLGFASGAMAEMKQIDSDFVLDLCLSAVTRRGGPDLAHPTWVPISTGGRLTFEDIDVMAMMELVDAVIQANLESFFARLRGGSAQPPETATEAAT